MMPAVLALTLVFALAASAAAQSGEPNLAEVARQAEAARSSVPKAKKTYTNADLSSDGLPPAPEKSAPAAGYMSASQNKPVSAEEMLELSNAKSAADEKQNRPDKFWIDQATTIRLQVEKLAARLAQLKVVAKNPDALLQKRTEQQIGDIQYQMERFKKRWAGLEEEARTAKVNLALLLPAPAFPE